MKKGCEEMRHREQEQDQAQKREIYDSLSRFFKGFTEAVRTYAVYLALRDSPTVARVTREELEESRRWVESQVSHSPEALEGLWGGPGSASSWVKGQVEFTLPSDEEAVSFPQQGLREVVCEAKNSLKDRAISRLGEESPGLSEEAAYEVLKKRILPQILDGVALAES